MLGGGITSTLEATVSMLKVLPESELLAIYDMARRFYIKEALKNPMEPMTEQQMIDKLAVSRKHAGEGRVMDADVAISKIREAYGL